MTRPIFIDSRHEAFYMNIMDRYPSMDIYREVFFYTMGLSADTRDHITELYDFDEGFISLDNLDAPWQTELYSTSKRFSYQAPKRGTAGRT